MEQLVTMKNAREEQHPDDPSQKVIHFINGIDQIGAFTLLDDSMLHLIATIELGGSAFNWYYNNKALLNSWSSLKANLKERFKPSLSTAKTQLKERQQQPGESLLTYYGDVIDLCKQDGVCAELKIHIKRYMKTLDDDPSLAQFLKIACDEEELQKEFFYSLSSNATATQPYFAHLTATTSPTITHTNHYSNKSRSSTSQSSRPTPKPTFFSGITFIVFRNLLQFLFYCCALL
ncbi:unnamed protein product [Adineta steineri]|nr:unnamed protein product [Adineta steineri]